MTKEDMIIETDFSFRPQFNVEEGEKGSAWLSIGGTALTEGVSKNANVYSAKNITENVGKKFKWLFGHPDNKVVEEHVVGMGQLDVKEGKLVHSGKIRNTASHPDVVESVRDGFLEPSIHARGSIRRHEGKNIIESLDIKGIGLVAFKGVKDASIDYAIAESLKDKNDLNESSEEDVNKDNTEGNTMSEEEIKKEPVAEEPKVEEPVAEEPKEVEAKEEEGVSERLGELTKEVEGLKLEKKTKIVESIIAVNSEMKKEELIKESDDKLALILEYETKLSSSSSNAIVEGDAQESDNTIVEKDGTFEMSKDVYKKFNKEIRERVR